MISFIKTRIRIPQRIILQVYDLRLFQAGVVEVLIALISLFRLFKVRFSYFIVTYFFQLVLRLLPLFFS